ncbi:LOW QUALITY PROTEIN: 5-carboxymethyl-2-hydroxymuconate semialdehyde dehydrogenase [Geomicrobium sp. JCM 19039]|nr:LOW QUALITY PROTEIN: 5-carboxymethyl-2-hydroxymuconate semialdehyde dehydrogenase [Geomicrobium sp. JCM 19039]
MRIDLEHVSEAGRNVIQNIGSVNHYINGAFTPSTSKDTFVNTNPYTNETINHVAQGNEQDVNLAVKAAQTAFHGEWGQMKLSKRLQFLNRIADLIDEHIDEIAPLESFDTGLPLKQTKKMVARAAQNFRFYAEMVSTRLVGDVYNVDDEFLNYTIHKPVGVAGLITPWNAPFMLETWKIAPALATGNTVVLKPAEWSPLTANRLAEIIDKAGLPNGVFNVVHGIGEVTGAALVAHRDVPLISFTGETKTGVEIQRNGAEHMKQFSMELGGKSPIIIFDDADLERALDACTWGSFSFNGERCTANSRLYVHESIASEFIERLKARVDNIRVGDPLDEATEIGPLIHRNHYDHVKSHIHQAKEDGVTVYQGNVPAEYDLGCFIPPTLLLNTDQTMRAVQEEIFGPVLTVMTFTDEADVIERANDVRYGLAGYVWTNDMKRGHRVAAAVNAGMLWVNAQNVRDLRTPFGGSKQSGIGREGGHYAFEFYTEVQIIHVALNDHPIPQFGKTNREVH